jgi:hypothetical protein
VLRNTRLGTGARRTRHGTAANECKPERPRTNRGQMLLSRRNSRARSPAITPAAAATESQARRGGANSHTGGARPSICVRQATRAASHRHARPAAAKGLQTKSKDGGNYNRAGGRRSAARSGGAAKCPHPQPRLRAGVCMIGPTTSPAGRAAVLLDYVLCPARFHWSQCPSSLNVAGEFRTSKKHRPSLKTSGLRARTALWFMF